MENRTPSSARRSVWTVLPVLSTKLTSSLAVTLAALVIGLGGGLQSVWALGWGNSGAQSYAGRSKSVLVRLKDRKHLKEAVRIFGLEQGHSTISELVSDQDAMIKVSTDGEDADRFRQTLMRSSYVESVSPNFLYRPLVNYSLQSVPHADGILDLSMGQFKDFVNSLIPPVQLPVVGLQGLDPLSEKDWALKSIRMPQNTHVQNTIVTAVIDTGVDYNHEDLREGMWRKAGKPTIVGADFAHATRPPYDLVHFDIEGCLKDEACVSGQDSSQYLVNPGHGTHCAGHVAAVAENALGMTGVGAGARVMALKFFYDFGEENAGQGDDAAAIRSIDYAIKNGVKVISASWGGRMSHLDAEQSELKAALIRARDAGVLFVAAAGNDHIDQDNDYAPGFPAAYSLDNMIVVAATAQDDSLAEFSNYGSTSVHIGAPGVKILSTTVGSKYSDLVAEANTPDGQKIEIAWDGTSMAAPIVAGAAALVWSKYPNENYRQIRDRILNSARKVPSLAGKVLVGGVLDVTAALR